MFNRKTVIAACGVAVLGLVVAASTDAWVSAQRTTYLTFSGPVALPDVTLGAGTYIFELADPNASLDIVRVLSRDRSRVYLTAFTRMIHRPTGLPSSRMVSFGEAAAGVPPPIQAWYPIGESTGHEFIYRNSVR